MFNTYILKPALFAIDFVEFSEFSAGVVDSVIIVVVSICVTIFDWFPVFDSLTSNIFNRKE